MVIPNNMWPKEYIDSDLIVSGKDEKINQKWLSKEDKDMRQNTANTIDLHGVLVVKEEASRRFVVGLSPGIAVSGLAGDYDGDPYDFVSVKDYSNLAWLIKEESKSSMVTGKISKPFTKREMVGNLRKIIEQRRPLLQSWQLVQNRFYNLSKNDKLLFVHIIDKSNILNLISSDDHGDLSDWEKTILEMQLGVKYDEDAPKISLDVELLMNWARQYEKELAKFDQG